MGQPADQVSGDEFGRLLGEEDIAVDEVEHLDRNVLEPPAAHQKDDRHFQTAPAHQIDQGGGLTLEPLFPPIDHQTADRRIGLHRHFGVFYSGALMTWKPSFWMAAMICCTRIPSRSSESKVGAENRNVNRWEKFIADF